MPIIKTVNAGWVNLDNVKRYYVTLDPATLNRYLVMADEAIIHFVIADDSDLPSLAKAGDKAHEWLDTFIATLKEGNLNDQSRTD